MMFLKIYSLIIYSIMMVSGFIGIGKGVEDNVEKLVATIVGILLYLPIFIYLILV